MKTWTLHNSDCLVAMRAMPDDAVDCVVTSPPVTLEQGGER